LLDFQPVPESHSDSLPRPTTVVRAPRLSERLGLDLTLVSETFQETGSFKFRAAWNLVRSAPQDLFVTVSSGNFGQALARAAQLAGKSAIVAMPAGSAAVKVEAVRAYGAEVVLLDPARESRAEGLARIAAGHPEAYVASPYDDPFVIAGNASLGREIAALHRRFDAVLVPVGGGGLSSGIATGLAEAGSKAALWGAEPALANDAARSLRSGRLESNDPAAGEPATLADGARTPSLGKRNWEILRHALAGIVEVPEAEIRAAVRLLFGLARLAAEPTGALTVGALLAEPDRFAGSSVAAVVSGGNVDPGLYASLIAPS
jgi:threonine dehydratase